MDTEVLVSSIPGCGTHRARKRAAIGASGGQPARSEGAATATVTRGVILIDTSVWVDHLRTTDKVLAALLDTAMVLAHPFVIGELALGNLRHREIVLTALADLPHASVADERQKTARRRCQIGVGVHAPVS